ncbi:Ovochymase-1 [Columba livia]|nr:Ovochymase-1 [Columba livia]
METHWAGVINKVILAGADTGQLKGVEEELLSSSQQRRQKLDANPFLKPPSLEKQTSDLKHRVHPINLKSTDDALPLGFFSQILGGRELVPGGQPWQVSLRLGRFAFCSGSLVQEDVIITTTHCVVSLQQKLLKSLVVTEEECHLQWDGRQEQNIPVLYVIIQPTFNQLHYMVCDMALQHQVRYALSSPKLLCQQSAVPNVSLLFGESGHIQYMQALEDNYPDNSLCTWNTTVPEDKIILIHFTKLYVEYPVGCDCVPLFKQKKADQSNILLHWTVTAEEHDRAMRESTEQMGAQLGSCSRQVPVLENEIYERNYYFIYLEGSQPGYSVLALFLWEARTPVSKENEPFTLFSPKKPVVCSREKIFLDWIRLMIKGQKLGSALKNPKEMSSELSQCTDVILTNWEANIQSPGYPMRRANAASPQEKKGKVEGSSPTLVYFPGNFCDDASTYPIKSQGSAVTVTFLSRAEVAMKGSLLTYATQETVSAILCGQKMSLSMFSSSSFLTLPFKTDESVGYRGFKILLEELYQQPTQSELEGSSLYLFEAKATHKLIYTALLLGVNSYVLQDGSVDYICSDTANTGQVPSPLSWDSLFFAVLQVNHIALGMKRQTPSSLPVQLKGLTQLSWEDEALLAVPEQADMVGRQDLEGAVKKISAWYNQLLSVQGMEQQKIDTAVIKPALLGCTLVGPVVM